MALVLRVCPVFVLQADDAYALVDILRRAALWRSRSGL
jgi:hypothetical protein